MKGFLLLSLGLMGSLVALTGLRQLFMQPLADDTVNFVWFVIQILPLLATLPGVLRGGIRSTFMLCMVSLLYFVHGVLIVFDQATQLLGVFEIVFALGLCAVAAWLVRQLREAEARAASEATSAEVP